MGWAVIGVSSAATDSEIAAWKGQSYLQHGDPVGKVLEWQRELRNESAIANFGKYYRSKALPSASNELPGFGPRKLNSTERSQVEKAPDHFILRA
jgi:hypothetical protein